MRRIYYLVLLVLINSLLIVSFVNAQWSTNPAVNNPISIATYIQDYPTMVSDGAGGAIITWEDYRGSTLEGDIYVQHINAGGVVQWTMNGLQLCGAAYGQAYPNIATDDSGGAIIAWIDMRTDGSTWKAYAQRINNAGVPMWTADGVELCTASSSQQYPYLVPDGAGGAIITWGDDRSGNVNIYTQKINAAGAVQWGASGLAICTAPNFQQSHSIVSDGSGGAIITWQDYRSSPTNVYAQRINNSGVVQWAANGIPICPQPNGQNFNPEISLVSDGSGGAVAVWTETRGGSSPDLYAQRISPSGALLWSPNGTIVCSNSVPAISFPTLTLTNDTNFVIVWMDQRNTTGIEDLYMQKLDHSGAPQWTVDGIGVCTDAHQQYKPAITTDDAGGAVIAWQDGRGASGFYNVYAQRVDGLGNPLLTANGVPVCTATGSGYQLKIFHTEDNETMFTWSDGRSDEGNIYASKLPLNGSVGGGGSTECNDSLWAKSSGGSVNDEGYSVALDAGGNSYVTGFFNSATITFGTTTLTNANTDGSSDMYLVKYDTDGNVVWAKRAGGMSDDIGNCIAVDASGNSYISGRFSSNSITFGSTTLTNSGDADIFVVKYDANGNVLRAISGGASGFEEATSIAIDASGNSYITGYFNDNSLTFGLTTLTNNGVTDMFVVKYNSSWNVLWATSAGGTNEDYAQSIGVDASGNCYVTGGFKNSSITFGATTLTNNGAYDIYLVKYNSSGVAQWAKSAGAADDDYPWNMAVDGSGNCYITGDYYNNSITFGTTTLTNNGLFDVYAVKYDASGNVVWASRAGGTTSEVGFGIAADNSGNCYITGTFLDSAFTFGSTTLINNGGWDIFAAKYDASGNPVWATSSGGTSDDYGSGIALDSCGNFYVTGYYYSPSVTFDATTLTNNGQFDMFLTKMLAGSAPPVVDTTKYRTFKESVSDFKSKSIGMSYKKGKLVAPPTMVTILQNFALKQMSKVRFPKGRVMLGIERLDSSKKYAWLNVKTLGQITTGFKKAHTGNSYAFDYKRDKKTSKKLKRLYNAQTFSADMNNPAIAQGLLFKMNILASDSGITPTGFGDLLLDTSFVLAGRNLKDQTMKQIANYYDTLITYWEMLGSDTTSYTQLASFATNVLKRINDGFYAPIDTAAATRNFVIDSAEVVKMKNRNQYAVSLKGVATASQVGIVKPNPTPILIPLIMDNYSTLPNQFEMYQNYPNPFNPITTIGFKIQDAGFITLKIYNMLGQEVATLFDRQQVNEGFQEVTFNASSLASGVYFYRINVESVDDDGVTRTFSDVKRAILMK